MEWTSNHSHILVHSVRQVSENCEHYLVIECQLYGALAEWYWNVCHVGAMSPVLIGRSPHNFLVDAEPN
jgi:hypothetical protein